MSPKFGILTSRFTFMALGALTGIAGTLLVQSGSHDGASLNPGISINESGSGQSRSITSSTPPDAGASTLDPALQDRLVRQVAAAVQAAVSQGLEQRYAVTGNPPTSDMALPQHQKTYENLKAELHNSMYNRTMTWRQLAANPQVQSLPNNLRNKLYSEATEMLNRGELSPEVFLNQANR
jgi:hypothetical protein